MMYEATKTIITIHTVCNINDSSNYTQQDYGRTALIYASAKGQAGSTRVLLEYGATVDLKDCVRGGIYVYSKSCLYFV